MVTDLGGLETVSQDNRITIDTQARDIRVPVQVSGR